MNNVPSGSRRLVLDKDAGTVCIGCNVSETDWEPISNISGILDFVAVESGDSIMVLDTGSTFTSKVSDSVCLVGYEDIDYLNVDYDRKRVRYVIDTEHVNSVCSKAAPSKLNGL